MGRAEEQSRRAGFGLGLMERVKRRLAVSFFLVSLALDRLELRVWGRST